MHENAMLILTLGGKYSEFLQPGVDILIFNTSTPINKQKLEFAAGAKIPAVTEQWLIESIKYGVKQDAAQYLVKTEIK